MQLSYDSQMRSSCILWVVPKSNGVCPCMRPTAEKHRAEAHAMMEADIGMMWSQAKEHLEPPEAGRDEEGISPKAF